MLLYVCTVSLDLILDKIRVYLSHINEIKCLTELNLAIKVIKK